LSKHFGRQSVRFENPVYIITTASTVGPKEGEGPLAEFFDIILPDSLCGEDSWEKAESKIVKDTFGKALSKSKLSQENIDYIISGDLLNQNSGSTFAIRDMDIPFFGIFGACSTMGEGMSLGALLIDGGFANNILVGASSHFCASEKQFRFPLELGTQRTPTSTWTVTGQGSAILSNNTNEKCPRITAITTGKIIDMGITDANNMGAAMAPAAFDTLNAHFSDLSLNPDYYDLIITGDLGYVGHDLVLKMFSEKNMDLSKNYSDCGILIFDKDKQDTNSGGSGCACSAVTFAGYLYKKLKDEQLNKLLFVPTGALMSPTSAQQGETIPGIAHAIAIENI
jgi:stage V sporulation protein AD